jgi:FKBP-type peptidyl-prolyl cis-trans isomerase FkpA
MKLSTFSLFIIIISIFYSSCNSIDFKKTHGGVPYKIFPSSKGDKIVPGNIIKYMIVIKVRDSVVRNSYTGMPEYEQVSESNGSYEDPHMELFLKSKVGDSIYYVQSMDTFIARQPAMLQQSPWKKGDRIETGIRIVKVYKNPADAQSDYMHDRIAYTTRMEKQNQDEFQKDPRVQEQMKKDDKIIEDYLAANHIQASKSPWGVYIEILNAGQGPKPENGEFALIRYKGTHMTGEVFDSNDKPGAELYPMQVGAQRSILGFEDGIKQLNKGTKARLFIPSALAYGPRGNAPVIKPNENLIFDVELVDITKTMPAPNAQPVNPDTSAHK